MSTSLRSSDAARAVGIACLVALLVCGRAAATDPPADRGPEPEELAATPPQNPHDYQFGFLSYLLAILDGSSPGLPSFFREDPQTGRLYDPISQNPSARASESAEAGPTKLTAAEAGVFHPNRRFAYFTTFGGAIFGYRFDPDAGAFTADTPGSPYAFPGDGESIAIDPSGTFVATITDEPSELRLYAVNAASGALTLQSTQTFTGFPRRVVFDGRGKFVFVGRGHNGVSSPGGLSVYALDRATGALTPAGTTLVGSDAGALVADRSGQFLFVSNFSNSALERFRIDPTSGALTSLGSLPGVGALGLGMDVDNEFLFTGGFGIRVLRLDTATGTLTQVPGSPFAPQIVNPLMVEPDATGRFLYAADLAGELPPNGNTPLYGLALDRATGALALLPDFPIDGGDNLVWLSASPRNAVDEAQLGAPFSTDFTSFGGTPPYVYAVTGGSLTPGLALDPLTGFLSGTPSTAGTFGFSVRSTDAAGAGSSKTLTFTQRIVPLGVPLPPSGDWLEAPAAAGYEFKVRFGGAPGAGKKLPACLPATLCVQAPGSASSDALLRVAGKVPSLVRFTGGRVELWARKKANGALKYYDLPAGAGITGALNGVIDASGLPKTSPGVPADLRADRGPDAGADPFAATTFWTRASDDFFEAAGPTPPAGPWLTTPAIVGYQFKVSVGAKAGVKEGACLPKTLCVSGTTRGRSDVLVRLTGPASNGYLRATALSFTQARVQVWVQQKRTNKIQYYDLAAPPVGSTVLPGLFDGKAFRP
jgi:6-phosphogluconolactonase (cycloisomerase 2 family)